ncbi:MAG: ionic transporter y4hA [Mycobacterium sp.]|nr:ionic transporter y4hA [Mycobacterium sp.]
MTTTAHTGRLHWTVLAPLAALVVLIATWTYHDNSLILALIAVCLVGAVLSAVHHAEVIAHRLGEPIGSLVLAVAVTIIEVGLIVMLMTSGGPGIATYARDTVFAAVMITLNGIVGVSLLTGALHHRLVSFNASGSGSALATVVTLAGVCLVLPGFTVTEPGLEYTTSQLAFAAVVSLGLYGAFVVTQTVRHRDFFLPVAVDEHGRVTGPRIEDPDVHADPPTKPQAWKSLGLLLAALVSVVGLAKLFSPTITHAVTRLGLPYAVVGVVIALVVLAPETIAAVNNARRDRVQISLNLAYGSAMASIGLTIPAIALAMIWLPGHLTLGLEPMQIVLLTLTVIVSVLTLAQGRAVVLEGLVHLSLLATFLFLSAQP